MSGGATTKGEPRCGRGRLHRFSIDALVNMLTWAGVRVRFTTARGARVA
jgi:predicted XRE-type DNA-binding protein